MEQNRLRTQYECSRLTATLVLNSFSEKALKPTDIIRFEWESSPKPKPINADLFNRRVAAFKNK